MDDEINHIKHKLPFQYRTDKAAFKESVSLLTHLIKTKRITPYLGIDIVYTLIALCKNEEWKKVVNDVYSSFGFYLQTELFKILAIDIRPNEEKDVLYKFQSLINRCDSDNEIMSICFIVTSDFIKPTLLSQMKNLTVVPPNISKFMGNCAFKKLKSTSNKIKCLQKLIDVTSLSEEQLEYLMENLEDPEFTNIVLDIFLRSQHWDYISIAEKRLNLGQKRYFEVDNNVHYFEFINLDKIQAFNSTDFIKVVTELIEIAKELYVVIDKIYNFVIFIINSSHSYGDKYLRDIFCHVWRKAEETNSHYELTRMIEKDFVSICTRGFATNLLLYLKELGDETDYIVMNEIFIKKDAVLTELRKLYDGDNEIWLNKEELTNEIKRLFGDIDEVINLIVSN